MRASIQWGGRHGAFGRCCNHGGVDRQEDKGTVHETEPEEEEKQEQKQEQ